MSEQPATFTWNADKAAANETKHGVSFAAAAKVFFDPHRLDHVDERAEYGEVRRNVTGAVEGIVLTVSYTMRGSTARIISARPASRKERNRYGDRP